MSYVDGFVTPVKLARREDYRAHAEKFGPIFKAQGALSVVECWGDDVPAGKLTSFPLAVKLEPDEVVVLSWVTWPSKAMRDEGWKKIMDDPQVKAMETEMPFDGKRLIFGGFETMLEL